MIVIKNLLIQIVFNFLIIIINDLDTYNCYVHNYSDSDGDGLTKIINLNRKYNHRLHKNGNELAFKPIYIYSTAFNDIKMLSNAKVNELQQNNYTTTTTTIRKSELIGKVENVIHNNSNISDFVWENFDIDTLVSMLENDNRTVTALLLDYFLDDGNTNNGFNDSSSRINYSTVFDAPEHSEGRSRDDRRGQLRHHVKVKKKYKKFLLPLLLAYKLKFFALIPVMISGLVLLTGSTGLAGFFFALFAAVIALKHKSH